LFNNVPASVCYPCSLQRYEANQAGLFLSQRRECAEEKWLNYVDFAPDIGSIQNLWGETSGFFTHLNTVLQGISPVNKW
jgi:hypothetical protein